MTYRRKLDTQHTAIVNGLRACGYFVADTNRAGFGNPDLFVLSKSGRLAPVEIKTPGEDLNKSERKWWGEFIDAGGHGMIVFSLQQALEYMAQLDES